MLQDIANHWWLMLIRGIAAIAFGIFAWAWPGKTLVILLMFYAGYALVEGISAIVLGFSGRERHRIWWQMLLVGLLGIAAAIVTFLLPKLTALVLVLVIASWAIVRGVFEIAAAIQLRKEIEGEWMEILAGIISILFGIAVLARPLVGIFAIVWLIGVFSVATGIVHVVFSFKLRNLRLPPSGEMRHAMGT